MSNERSQGEGEAGERWRTATLQQVRVRVLDDWPEAVGTSALKPFYDAIQDAPDKEAYMDALQQYQIAARTIAHEIRGRRG